MHINQSYLNHLSYLNHKNQVIVLLISNGKKWHYLAVKKLFPLLEEKHQIMLEIFIVKTGFIHLVHKH